MSAKSKSVSKKPASSKKKTTDAGAARLAKTAKKPAKAETTKVTSGKPLAAAKPASKVAATQAPAPKAAGAAKSGTPAKPVTPVAKTQPVAKTLSGSKTLPGTKTQPIAKTTQVAKAAPPRAAKDAPATAPGKVAAPTVAKPMNRPATAQKLPPLGQTAAAPAGLKPIVQAPQRAPQPMAPVRSGPPAVQAPKAPASAAVAPAALDDAAKKKSHQRHGFRTNEYVVYPSHGVGKIIAIEQQTIAGMSLELFVINFEQEKMTLRVPTAKLEAVRMRKLAEEDVVRRAMETLKGRARIKRTMWSRRAQEYESKINSGDLVQISEVVRDLYRAETQPEQSYSERQLFEAALDRMSREIAAIEKLDDRGAVQKIVEVLARSARGRKPIEEAPVTPPATEEQAA